MERTREPGQSENRCAGILRAGIARRKDPCRGAFYRRGYFSRQRYHSRRSGRRAERILPSAGEGLHGNTAGVDSVSRRHQEPESGADDGARGGNPRIHHSDAIQDRRTSGAEPGRGGADAGSPCGLRHARRQVPLRRKPPGLRSQDAHRPPRPRSGPSGSPAG